MLGFAVLAGCAEEEQEDGTGARSLLDCDTQAIEQQAGRNGFQLAFAACGSNTFNDFSWSTDGHKLYYQLGTTQHVLLADTKDKRTVLVPAPTAIAAGAWVSGTRVVMPVGPNPDVDHGPLRLATFDLDTKAVVYVNLPADLKDPADLTRTRDPEKVLVTAVRGDAPRRVWQVSLVDGATEPAYDWLGAVDTFTFTPAADRVVAGRGDTATVYDATSQAALGSWTPATRGVVHPKAHWVMLEHDGPAYQLLAPDGETPTGDPVPTPMLSFAAIESGQRWTLSTVHGSKWEWYEITDLYGSFVLWGFDGKPYRRNILLGDLLQKVTGTEMGELLHGVKPFGEADGARFSRP